MHPQLLFHRTGHQLLRYQQHLKTRRAYCFLSLLSYTNGLIMATWLFSERPLLLDVLFCIASALIGVSITGLYLNKPTCMLPDIIYKVIIVACGLFYAFVESDSGRTEALYTLGLVAVATALQIYENYFLFNAIATLLREQEGLVQARPPPSYSFFATSQSKTFPVSNPDQSGSAEPEEVVVERPDTPPPTYEIAMERLRQSNSHAN